MIVVDTHILIDAGRNVEQALACLKQYECQAILTASIITKMELVIGCRDKSELYNTEKFLRRFRFSILMRISLKQLITYCGNTV